MFFKGNLCVFAINDYTDLTVVADDNNWFFFRYMIKWNYSGNAFIWKLYAFFNHISEPSDLFMYLMYLKNYKLL